MGRLIRAPLSWIPRHIVLPIVQGPLRGSRWIVGAATHGCWLGVYELPKQRAFAAEAARSKVIFDVGANVGFYTLLAASIAGTSRVFAFEPLPRNLAYLNQHVQLNRLANVQVIAAAVGNASGIVRFDDSRGPSMGLVTPRGQLEVPAVALDELSASGDLPDPDLIKIDVEGSEDDVLAGAASLLSRARPTIFLATHGDEIHRRCSDRLQSLGYSLEPLSSDELIARPHANRSPQFHD
ncbi:MAG: FkbM family methyltransferase [Vicinamibacterales bacterium]